MRFSEERRLARERTAKRLGIKPEEVRRVRAQEEEQLAQEEEQKRGQATLRAKLRAELREELLIKIRAELRAELLAELPILQTEEFANLRRENGKLFDENARLRLERDAERVRQKQKARMYYLKRVGRVDPVTGEMMYTLKQPRLTHLSPEERVQRRLTQQKDGAQRKRAEAEAQHSRYNAQGRLERHCEPCEKEGIQGGWLPIDEFQPRGTGYEKLCHRHAMRRRRQQEEASRPPVVVYDAAKKHAEIKEQARLRREQREAGESTGNTER
jgi:hypothetical protein